MTKLCCSFALACVVLGGPMSLCAFAQPARTPDSKPVSKQDPRIMELVQRARAVMGDVQSLSYTAEVSGLMPDGNRVSKVSAGVTAERGEETNWKFLVDGTFAIEPKAGGRRENEQEVKAAYDGNEVWVMDSRRKVVRVETTKAVEAVRQSMIQGSAATSVAWELFGETPLAGCDVAIKAELEPPQTVDGLECEVVWFVPPRARSAAGAVHESAIVPSKMYFAKRDGLPRRFEIYRPAASTAPAGKRGEPTRTLTLVGLVAKADLSGKSFTFDVPEGFNIIDGTGKRRARQPSDQATPPKDSGPATTVPPKTPDTSKAEPTTYRWPLLPSDNDAMRVGTQAPAFDLKDFDGKSVKLSDFAGKVLVLDFWGTWCPPCRASMPAIQKVHEKFKDRGVVVLGMNSEGNPKANPKKFKEDNKFTYPSVTKAETVSGLYKVQGWPTFYVIGKDGKVVWGSTGLQTPPGGGGGAAAQLEYLESNLSQAIEKALEAK